METKWFPQKIASKEAFLYGTAIHIDMTEVDGKLAILLGGIQETQTTIA